MMDRLEGKIVIMGSTNAYFTPICNGVYSVSICPLLSSQYDFTLAQSASQGSTIARQSSLVRCGCLNVKSCLSDSFTIRTGDHHWKSSEAFYISMQTSVQLDLCCIYSATILQGAKAAVHLMAESLAMELRPFLIQVTTVIPGWVKSDIINNAPPNYGRSVPLEKLRTSPFPSFKFPTRDYVRPISWHGLTYWAKMQVYKSTHKIIRHHNNLYHLCTSIMSLSFCSEISVSESVICNWPCFLHSMDTLLCRYERPGSFYEHAVPALKKWRLAGISQGMTTQETAIDIANGISKPRPKRFLFTGKMLFYSLFWGWAQIWLRPKGLAESLEKRCNLYECAEKGTRKWDGPYIKPEEPKIEKLQAEELKTEEPKLNGTKAEEFKPLTNGASLAPELPPLTWCDELGFDMFVWEDLLFQLRCFPYWEIDDHWSLILKCGLPFLFL